MTLADELSRLAELRANGGLTEEEFRRAKERLLNAEQTRPRPARVRCKYLSAQPRRPVVRRRVRRNRSIDRNGSLGLAAAVCRPVYLRGGRPAVVRAAVDFRAKRVTRGVRFAARSASAPASPATSCRPVRVRDPVRRCRRALLWQCLRMPMAQ